MFFDSFLCILPTKNWLFSNARTLLYSGLKNQGSFSSPYCSNSYFPFFNFISFTTRGVSFLDFRQFCYSSMSILCFFRRELESSCCLFIPSNPLKKYFFGVLGCFCLRLGLAIAGTFVFKLKYFVIFYFIWPEPPLN